MIAFQLIGKKGRLGNSLFQVASTVGLAHKHKTEFSFNDNELSEYFKGPFPIKNNVLPELMEQHYHFHDWEIKGDIALNGYLQSRKYWKDCEKEVREMLCFKDHVYEGLKEYNTENAICITVRRGDFVNNSNYYQLGVMYYILALIEHFPDWRTRPIIILSDNIEWCRVHFECLPNVRFAEDLNAYEQLALGTLCSDFIISNSTFSWWVAYLANRGKVIRPVKNMAGELERNNDEKDYWLENWQIYDYEGKKIDAKDVTFTIPVSYDHQDRKKNIDLSVCLIQKDFDTNVIVAEQGSDVFGYFSQWCKYVKYDHAKFHRTKMLNDMAVMAETDLIVNWDCDNVLPPMQLYMMIDRLRGGDDFVYPFDGRVARLPREDWFKKISKTLDVGVVAGHTLLGKNGRAMKTKSVGHAVGYTRDSFIDAGMENEYMVSWGPEDWERWFRFNTLGYKVSRVPGMMYHIDHWVGPNSSSGNPLFIANEEEYKKIKKFSPEQLREYVNTWPWAHQYTDGYYKQIIEGSRRSAKAVFELLFKKGVIKSLECSVMDVGCGIGEWNNDNPNYYGLDYKAPVKRLLMPKERYTDENLEQSMRISDKRFDLCLCLEVAEHISTDRAGLLVQRLCEISDTVLFSAAIPGQGGVGHINEQWQSWWADLFAKSGYYPHKLDIRKELRTNPEVEIWYKNNAVLYTKAKHEIAYDLDFVHPVLFSNIVGTGK